MKFLINRFYVLALILLAVACAKEESLEGGTLTPILGQNEWSFLDSSALVRGTVDTAFRANLGTVQSALFAGPSDVGNGVILLEIVGPQVAPGTYTTDNVVFEYYVNGSLVYKSVPSSEGNFSVVVTEVDSVRYSGTFSGDVIDAQGVIRTIRDGKFNANFSPAPPASTTGTLTIWAQQLCDPAGNIEIRILNQQQFISQTFTTEPTDCGVTGAANFTLPAGTHPVQVICGSDTSNLSIDIEANVCQIAELTF